MHDWSWHKGVLSIPNPTQEKAGSCQWLWLGSLQLSNMLLILWTDELLQVAFSGRSSFSCEESSWKKCMQFSFFPAEADKRMNCPFWRWKREIQFPNRKWEILSNPKVHFLSCPTQFSPFLISNTHQHHLLQGLSLSSNWFFYYKKKLDLLQGRSLSLAPEWTFYRAAPLQLKLVQI